MPGKIPHPKVWWSPIHPVGFGMTFFPFSFYLFPFALFFFPYSFLKTSMMNAYRLEI